MTGPTTGSAIRVTGLSKVFPIYRSPKHLLLELITRKQRHTEFWALKNVSFEVGRGEVMGVIGRNGAGKSTLLKIIAGTLPQTSGTVEVSGKVAAILELGTGFHSEYTGRENVIMGGMVFGMSRAEIERKVESIIDFSELRAVIDQPFKTYSSGMKARLTFATAISVESEILIIDEALATGDAFFVVKCLRRIQEICDSGATVFFVSHQTELVKRLCNRAILIENGTITEQGDARAVMAVYETKLLEESSRAHANVSVDGVKLSSGEVEIEKVEPLDDRGLVQHAFFQHTQLAIEISVRCHKPVTNPAVWIKFTRSDGVVATSWFSHEPAMNDIGVLTPGVHKIVVTADDIMLGDGRYQLTIGLFPEKKGAQSTFYVDPYCLWDRIVWVQVSRRTRPVSTVFDQPMRIAVRNDGISS